MLLKSFSLRFSNPQDKTSLTPLDPFVPAAPILRKFIWQVLEWMITQTGIFAKLAATLTSVPPVLTTFQKSQKQETLSAMPCNSTPLADGPAAAYSGARKAAVQAVLPAALGDSFHPKLDSADASARRFLVSPAHTSTRRGILSVCHHSTAMYQQIGEMVDELEGFVGPELLSVAAAVLRMTATCECLPKSV